MKRLWKGILVFLVLCMAAAAMPVYAQEGDLELGVAATIDGTKVSFWQESTEVEDGVMYAVYYSFDENGVEQYKLRIGLALGIGEGSYQKSGGVETEPRFVVSFITDPDAGISSGYCLSSYETDYIRNSSYELTITDSDSLSGHYHGTFEGTAVLWKGSSQMEITDVEFDMVKNQVSPNYGNGGASASGTNNSPVGNSGGAAAEIPSADSDTCPKCDGRGSCSKCGGLGEDICSCLGGSCPSCSGFGYKSMFTSDGIEYRDCSTCGGSGFHARCNGTGFLECTLCNGTGTCSYCGGTGDR